MKQSEQRERKSSGDWKAIIRDRLKDKNKQLKEDLLFYFYALRRFLCCKNIHPDKSDCLIITKVLIS